MGVHYPRNLIGRIRAAKLLPVTIAIGGDICWQGGVTLGEQLAILGTLQEMERRHPVDQLPAAVERGGEDDDDDTTLSPVPSAPVKPSAPSVPSTNGKQYYAPGAAAAAPVKSK